MDTNPLYSSDTWQRIYQNFLDRGIDPVQAERMATEQARTVVANDAASQRALAIKEALPDSALKAAPTEDKYSGMTPAEAAAARAQDLATYKFWQAFQGAPETPREDRRPSFQKLSGLAARSQAIDPEKASEAQRLADIARQKIEASTMRPSSYEPTSDPGRTDFNQLYANLDKARGVTPEAPAPAAAAAPAAPASGTTLPMFAQPNWGAQPVAANVQDRSVAPGLLAMAGQRVAPYATQFNNADLMRFSTDKAPVAATAAAPARRAAPAATAPAATAPAAAATAPAQQGSLLSRIFSAPKDPYAGQSAAQLMKTANENPDSAAAFFRADKALQKEQPEMFKPQAERRGGSVTGGKDAALHKALEIIHHMLTRGH